MEVHRLVAPWKPPTTKWTMPASKVSLDNPDIRVSLHVALLADEVATQAGTL